ncbi:MAG: hypothetical protein CFE41_03705 [Burkholderiales bacterium PBB2]|nr:MAG: hypothetical protein CFE41_03705 [Burkholderiales bacterium PBB2]
MASYGDVAVRAVMLIRQGVERSPSTAWGTAVAEFFPSSKSSREKSCPRGAFLGLCESGRVQGVSAGTYTRSKKNKEYALLAVDLLNRNPDLVGDVKLLWNAVLAGATKEPNHQMTVVAALWEKKLVLP